jgi:hypothetical protein
MLEGGIHPMLRWISILGGLLIMMGQHDRSEALFYTSAWKIKFLKPTYCV